MSPNSEGAKSDLEDHLRLSQLDGRVVFVIALGISLYAALCIAMPLAIYTMTLAVFGLPHVISELRFVDRRFGLRVDHTLLWRILPLLCAAALARAFLVFHLVPAKIELPAELGIVALLALSIVDSTFHRRIISIFIAFMIGGGAALAPFDTSVILAVLHNLTPLGFLWQLSPRRARTRIMSIATFAFVGFPIIVATGLPRTVLPKFIGITSFDPLGAGSVQGHLYVYVPAALAATSHAIDLFTASVVAQGAHYLSVIVVLPMMLRRIEPNARGLISWPLGTWFALLCIGASSVGMIGFSNNFAESRALYGIISSFHAWLEIPLLIFALFGTTQALSQSPTRLEATFASRDTIIAR